jgi:hypothetical protein
MQWGLWEFTFSRPDPTLADPTLAEKILGAVALYYWQEHGIRFCEASVFLRIFA